MKGGLDAIDQPDDQVQAPTIPRLDERHRNSAIQAIAAQQGGRFPFTDIFLDIAANGSTTDFPTWKSSLDSNIAFTEGLFPGVPIVMPTMTPKTSNLNSQFWTTLADQGLASSDGPGPNATHQQVDAYILTKPGIASALDLMSALTADQNDKWPLRAFSATVSTSTVVATTSVWLSAAPDIGAALVFEPGNPTNGEIVNAVKSVSGSGPYLVTFTEIASVTKAHATSTLVAESSTVDGTHGSVAFYEWVKAAMVSLINAASFP